MTQEKTTTKSLWTNARAWWLLQVRVVSVVLVMASLLLSNHPVAAQTPASDQYEPNEPTTSAPASPAKPGAETDTTAPPSDTHNESEGGEAFDPAQEAPRPSTPGNSEGGEDPSASPAPPSGPDDGKVPSANTSSTGDPNAEPDTQPIDPSIPPDVSSQGEEPKSVDSAAPSVPKAAVDGLLNGLNELHVALNSLLDTMMGVFPFGAEQPANPEAETNTTPPPSDTQNTPVQQEPAPDNVPGSSEVTEDPSANSPEPGSETNGGPVPSGNTTSPGDPNAPWPESGCADPSALTPQQAFKCEMDKDGMRGGDWGGMWLY